MPLELKPIGNDDFESLLAEARARIPVHAPEWTHVGESDPGITLLELFAFMSETLLYRANRIPERNRLKFLKLLRLGLKPGAPAEGFVVFNAEKASGATVLAAGVELLAGKVPFRTTTPITILPVEARVLYKKPVELDDDSLEDYAAAYEGFRATDASELSFYETTPLPEPEPARPLPALDIDVDAAIDRSIWIALLAPKGATLSDTRNALGRATLSVGIVPALDEGASVSPFSTASRLGAASSEIAWEIATDQTTESEAAAVRAPVYQPLQTSAAVDVLQAPGIVNVTLPPADELTTFSFDEPSEEGTGDYPPRIEDEEVRDRIVTWLRLRFRGSHPGADLSWVGVNAARVMQARVVTHELMGRGSGEPDQVLQLAHTPVLAGTLRVELEETDGSWTAWTEVEDFLSFGSADEVYLIDREAGAVTFGSGLAGRRPPLDARIRASYEYGGGTRGNVPIRAISKAPSLPAAIKVSNPLPARGGAEPETAADGEQRIPSYLRHRERAVTQQDFEDLARATPGVDLGRVEVLPLYHPDLGEDNPGVVTLLVIPSSDPADPAAPMPDTLFLRTICNYIEPRRLITTEVHVVGPCYVPVWISLGIRVRSGYGRDSVIQAVRAALTAYLSPLHGGPDGDGWPLRRKVVARDLEAVATRVGGVEYVEGELLLAGETARETAEIRLGAVELPRLIALVVTESEPEPIAQIVGDAPVPGGAADVMPVPVVPEVC